MSINLEEIVRGLKYQDELVTDKNIETSGTITASNITTTTDTFEVAATFEDAVTVEGQLDTLNPVLQQTITNIDAQNATPTIANILGGIVIHTSVTGAGTATVPTGTAMSAGVDSVAVGSTIEWLYYNDGSQTVTITAAAGHTLVGGTAAVTTGKHMKLVSVNTAANTWVTYLETLM